MAITALNSAATGLRALSTRIDVIANNLANAETTAFKRSRMNFEDLMYVTLKEPGSNNNANEPSPAGTFVGLGVKISNTQLDLEQGPLESTTRPLDVAIQGNGFFRVKIMDSVGDGTGYLSSRRVTVESVPRGGSPSRRTAELWLPALDETFRSAGTTRLEAVS